MLLENNKTARQTHVEAGLTQKAAFAHFKDGVGPISKGVIYRCPFLTIKLESSIDSMGNCNLR